MFQSDESYIIYRESPNWSKLAARENLLPIFYLFFFPFYTQRNLLNPSFRNSKKKKNTFYRTQFPQKLKKSPTLFQVSSRPRSLIIKKVKYQNSFNSSNHTPFSLKISENIKLEKNFFPLFCFLILIWGSGIMRRAVKREAGSSSRGRVDDSSEQLLRTVKREKLSRNGANENVDNESTRTNQPQDTVQRRVLRSKYLAVLSKIQG